DGLDAAPAPGRRAVPAWHRVRPGFVAAGRVPVQAAPDGSGRPARVRHRRDRADHSRPQSRTGHGTAAAPLAECRDRGGGRTMTDAVIEIISPVYNAPDDLRRCLDALVDRLPAGARVQIVDDASPVRDVAAILRNH